MGGGGKKGPGGAGLELERLCDSGFHIFTHTYTHTRNIHTCIYMTAYIKLINS